MTDKEVRKLKRAELLEILFYLQKELDGLRAENENLRRQLESAAAVERLSDAALEQITNAVKAAMEESNDDASGTSARK